MKPWTAFVGVAGIAAGFLSQPKPQTSWTLVIGGDIAGYLSPCGCTYPMSGGIRRWTTAVRKLGNPSHNLILENGGLVTGNGRQDVYKAEAIAEALGQVHATAVNLTASEAQLGPGELSELAQLSDAKFVSTTLNVTNEAGLSPFTSKGPFLVGGAVVQPSSLSSLGPSEASPVETANRLAAAAKGSGLVPVLMFDGDLQAATDVAKAVPSISLIVYSRAGDPPFRETYVGKTMLVTPGEHGKFLVKIAYANGRFTGYGLLDLGPAVTDDPQVSKIYDSYLRTVDSKNLIDEWRRKSTDPFAGTKKCAPCHQEAVDVWNNSKHHGSYTDLRAQGHGKDPDCVVCHVTGLDSEQGFRDLSRTPDLAYVGCESCHGPGEQHSSNPSLYRMPKIGKESCLPCHDSENSPRFDFLTYWSQIKHR